MRYLTLGEVIEVYRRVMAQSGGALGIRSLDALESSVAQPRMTFGGKEFYPSIVDKAAALGFALTPPHHVGGEQFAQSGPLPRHVLQRQPIGRNRK
jgi:death-on-curing protein